MVVTPLTFAKSLSVRIATFMTVSSDEMSSTVCNAVVNHPSWHRYERSTYWARTPVTPLCGRHITAARTHRDIRVNFDSTVAEERLSHSNRVTGHDAVHEVETAGGERDDRRAVAEVAQLITFLKRGATDEAAMAGVLQIERWVEDIQVNAGHENGRHRHQRHGLSGPPQRRVEDRALVLAEEPLDALQRDGIDVPGVAGDVGHLVDDRSRTGA